MRKHAITSPSIPLSHHHRQWVSFHSIPSVASLFTDTTHTTPPSSLGNFIICNLSLSRSVTHSCRSGRFYPFIHNRRRLLVRISAGIYTHHSLASFFFCFVALSTIHHCV